MEEEDNDDMMWDRHPSRTLKADNMDLQAKLVEAFHHAGVKTTNNQYHESLCKYAGKQTKFMSKPTFNKWMNGGATKNLDGDNRGIMKGYVKKHNKVKER